MFALKPEISPYVANTSRNAIIDSPILVSIKSEGIDNFWKVIVEGRNCTVDIPSDRFDKKKWYDPDYNKAGKTWTCRAALIEGLDEFDNKLFGISNSETVNMDPQHKLLLECTYRALEDAGFPMESVSGSNTGVFIGDCEMAVCGGVNSIMEPRIFIALSKAKMISPDGTSKPFSKNANGYGRGEGCGIVVLKKLKKDGKSVTPITRPSQDLQEALLKTIYSIIDPSTVQYVEAHGTGTPVGDPVEAASIGKIIGKKRPSGSPLKIGSVKGNIGHTESASGVAGLIKVLLMMHHEVIPPSLHYSKETGIAQVEESNLTIPITPETWKEDRKLGRIASINSFGFGGTNVHAVIKQVKQHRLNDFKHLSQRPVEIFVVSAASSKSLQLTIEDTKQQLNRVDSLSFENLVYTSACRRSHKNFKFRKTFLASSLKNLQEQLAKANTESSPAQKSPEIVFVFCGNGLLYKGMCKMLLRSEPVFRKKCIEIDELLQVYTSLSMVKLLESEFDDFSRPDIAQLLLFTIQTSLVALLRHWGVKPDTIVGHSVGEVAAAHCSGLLSLQDAVKVIYYRSTLQSKVTGGKMLVVSNIPVTEISKDIRSYGQRINMAAYNSPISCTISGDAELIVKLHDQLNQQYSKRNIFLHQLDVPAAYHSHMMDPILSEIEDKLQDLKAQTLETDIISTVTGVNASKGDFTIGGYWARNIREPVAFEQAIKSSIAGKQNPVFIEIGPKRALQWNITDVLGEKNIILPAVHPNKEYETIFAVLVKLFTEGYNPDWCHIYETYKSPPAVLPRHQFDHVKQGVDFGKIQEGNKTIATSSHPLIHNVSQDFTDFQCTISKENTPYVYKHKYNETTLVPGTFYIELGLAAAMTRLKSKMPLSSLSISVNFASPCVVNQDSLNLNIKLEHGNILTDFSIQSSHIYATGQIQKSGGILEEKRISFQRILKRCNLVLIQEKVYESLSKFGFQYGKPFRQLSDIHYGGELMEGIARVTVSEEIIETMYEYNVHPVVLDCFFQMGVITGIEFIQSSALFPSQIGNMTVFRPLQKQMFIYLKTVQKAENHVVLCGGFTNENGCVLIEINQAKISFIHQVISKQKNIFFHNNWVTLPPQSHKGLRVPNILVFADNSGIGQELSKYTNDTLKYVMFKNWELDIDLTKNFNSKFTEIWFMWGIHTPSEEFPNNLPHYLARCCEMYRQVILAVRQLNSGASIRTVTFRTAEPTVDHINPGFALTGMTRTCATEMPDITFQLIDISSSNVEDVKALARVAYHYTPRTHPEVWIHKGEIYTSEVTPTEIDFVEKRHHAVSLKKSDNFTLYTANPYIITELSAELDHSKAIKLTDKCVEVQIDQICSHSDDFFPVSASGWKFGNTLYWSTLSTEKHKLLALDFTGTVTAVGKHVKKLKVGDRVATCYPTLASSKVGLPETVCCLIQKVPILKKLPCISQFILAWEVLHHLLPPAKNKPKLIIISTEKKTVLSMILMNAAKGRGWEPMVSPEIDINTKQCSAMIILPPSKNILEVDFLQLSLLKDLIIIADQKNPESFQYLTEHCSEDTHIELLNPVTVFQKAHLKKFAKEIYKWLQSTHIDLSVNHSKSITMSVSRHCLNDTEPSYFTMQNVPLIEIEKSNITFPVKEETLFNHDAIYIVAGGLTGLGFETVKFIAQNGGGNIVILSRRRPTPEMQEDIKKIQNEQVNIKIMAIPCDITSYSEVIKTVNSILKIFSNIPIKGVFHSAVVLHDGILESLNLSLFEKVLSPKVDGAVNLHRATIKQELDYFVCYSSVASFVGNAGQSNYAAANSFLDVFCQYRRNMGLSGQSISWGALNLGVLQDQDNIHEILNAKGILLFDPEEIHRHLKKALRLNKSLQAVIKFDFKALYEKLLSRIPTLKKLLIQVITEESKHLNGKIQFDEPSKHTNMKSTDYVKMLISELTSASASEITMNTFLSSLGIDSMMGMSLQSRILQEKNVNIPVVQLLDPSTTISVVVSLLNENTSEGEDITTNVQEETQF
ncbi:highly reducing polyketide synthase SAT13-like [Pelobates cultripes]|uniref:Highly reducing polyketide synthase SAT13-like n=1 Tax=Pelobates cultripes TaxID=61616 RepID=A0AAD1W316_PELCU|nr:highly reducing polyketide synthase SAT13-like [Pelobates cultripes]